MLLEVFEILFQNTQGKANRLLPRKLFTAGYGNQPESDFIARLQQSSINFIFDVRRKEARSWNPSYYPGNSRIGKLFRRNRIPYWALLFHNPHYDFGNRFDTLADYENWIRTERNLIPFLENLAAFVEGNTGIVPCLLCAERSYEKCHRTLVAAEMVKYINAIAYADNQRIWKVEHI